MSRRRLQELEEFEEWRRAARHAWTTRVPPERFDWRLDSDRGQATLELVSETASPSVDAGPSEVPAGAPAESKALRVPPRFLRAARRAAYHRDPERWRLLYRILYRLQSRPRLLEVSIDDDVQRLHALEREVRRDVHKTRAFVRFNKLESGDAEGRAEYVAWHGSDHDVLPLTVDFFVERFHDQVWSIHTPFRSARWDGSEVRFGPGVERAPTHRDELEQLWGAYYGSIFNPARLNLRAMRAEMPVRYWKSMPETGRIATLVQEAGGRTASMLARGERPSANALIDDCRDLTELRTRLERCRACPLGDCDERPVFGEGAAGARLMIVGEAPGDQEERQGRPFVGPAGRHLDQALERVGVCRDDVYLTNAVKHFKYERRGKLRIHKSPGQIEVSSCAPWLRAEIATVEPEMIVCLGATAARSLLGADYRHRDQRGRVLQERRWAPWMLATYHPAMLLRADPGRREVLERTWAKDWQLVAEQYRGC